MKSLVIPSQITNLWVKLWGPILKLTTIEPFTPTPWPLAVLIHILLLDIWCRSHCVVLNATYLWTSIKQWWEYMIIYLYFKGRTFCIPFMYKIPPYLFLLHCSCSSLFHSPLVVRLMKSPIFWSFHSCPTSLLPFVSDLLLFQRPELNHLW